MNPAQFARFIIKPTLMELDLYSKAAERLLLGTALVESDLRFIKQLGGGPALGVYQMEPATHDDIWQNFLRFRPELAGKIRAMTVDAAAEDMIWNLRYATAMARMQYFRVKERLPKEDSSIAMAKYHKKWYNTPLGATQLADSVPIFEMVMEI